jgi:hypothetical protein
MAVTFQWLGGGSDNTVQAWAGIDDSLQLVTQRKVTNTSGYQMVLTLRDDVATSVLVVPTGTVDSITTLSTPLKHPSDASFQSEMGPYPA